MTSIDPINVNTQGIGGALGFGTNSKAANKENDKGKDAVSNLKQTPVSADDVLSYLAQSAVSVTPQKATSVDTSKYVDNESAARIAGFMADFEDKVASGLAAFDKEFGDANVSDSAKMAVVLAGIDKES